MTQAQWESLALTILKVLGGTAAGGLVFSKLGIDPANLPALVAGLGGLVAAAATVWSLLGHTDAKTVEKAAKITPISTSNQVAAGVPMANTTPPSQATNKNTNGG